MYYIQYIYTYTLYIMCKHINHTMYCVYCIIDFEREKDDFASKFLGLTKNFGHSLCSADIGLGGLFHRLWFGAKMA